jgi:hypothetical protein
MSVVQLLFIVIIVVVVVVTLFASVPQAKGVHDHPRPEAKSTSEARRCLGAGRRVRGLAVLLAREAALGSKVTKCVAGKTPHLCVTAFS